VANGCELLVTKGVHEPNEVRGNGSLGLLCMIRAYRGLARRAVAAHVRAHDGEPSIHQARSHPMPGCTGSRVTVHKEHRQSLARVTDAQRHLADVHAFVFEAVEHGWTVPVWSRLAESVEDAPSRLTTLSWFARSYVSSLARVT